MFLYFDLGNVLLNFDHQLACRQMGEVAGVPAERIWHLLFETDLELRYESGQFDDAQFYEIFCKETGSRPNFDRLALAASEIFQLNASIVPVVSHLDAAGYRMGILSNTSPVHWNYCSRGRYALLRQAFDVIALSYELGVCKPDPKIFIAAAKLAGVTPREIFYVDDILSHVTSACEVGYDAVQYTTTPKLVEELRARGITFNY